MVISLTKCRKIDNVSYKFLMHCLPLITIRRKGIQQENLPPNTHTHTHTHTHLHLCPHSFPSLFVCVLSGVQLSATPWTVPHQVLLSMEFSRQEYWRRMPFPTPGDLPDPGIKLMSLALPSLAGRFFTTVPPGKSLPSLLSLQVNSP